MPELKDEAKRGSSLTKQKVRGHIQNREEPCPVHPSEIYPSEFHKGPGSYCARPDGESDYVTPTKRPKPCGLGGTCFFFQNRMYPATNTTCQSSLHLQGPLPTVCPSRPCQSPPTFIWARAVPGTERAPQPQEMDEGRIHFTQRRCLREEIGFVWTRDPSFRLSSAPQLGYGEEGSLTNKATLLPWIGIHPRKPTRGNRRIC